VNTETMLSEDTQQLTNL